MALQSRYNGRRRDTLLRMVVWGGAGVLLLLPAVAMRFTSEVNWDGADFIVMGLLLGAVCGGFEIAVRMSRSTAYRAAAGVAIVAAFLLIWVNLAVGVIGSEENPANTMFAGVLAVAAGGAIVARFRPGPLAHALVATALTQATVGAVALIGGLGAGGEAWPRDVIVLTTFFCAMWLTSAWLFRRAAVEEAVL